MFKRNWRLNGAVAGALAAMGVGIGMMPNHIRAATLYYNANGTGSGYGTSNNGTTNWEGNVWSTTNSATASASTWVQGSSAQFLATSPIYTVAAANDEQVVGVENASATASVTTIISQKATTSGQLDIGNTSAAFRIDTGTDGLEITAPIVGTGGQVVQHGNGTLYLYGQNTFSGGMEVTGGQLTYYNNSSSFGTGNIIIGGGTSNAFLSGAAGQVTIPNNWTVSVVYPLNLVGGVGTIAAPGTIFSGNFPIPAGTTQNIETSNNTSVVDEISGIISGGTTSNVEFSDLGTMVLTGPNTYQGTTLVTSAVNGPVVLVLGASGTIASSSQIIMNGGVLNPDGLNQNMSSKTTLALTGTTTNSTIDFGAGNAEMDFKDSSGVAWTSGDILNLKNWSFSFDAMRFGTTSGGLTPTQLAEIEFNGNASTLGTAYLNAQGYLVPEPASTLMLLMGTPMLVARRRRGC